MKRSCDTVMIIDFNYEVDSDLDRINNDIDNNNNSKFSSLYTDDKSNDIDDDCDVEFEETQTFLYQHFIIIIIVVNETLKKLNFIFMKITLLHIKEKNNNSRM